MKNEKDEKRSGVIFLKGKKVILRPPRKETDLEMAVCWVNDQEVTQYLSMFLPQSFGQEEKWFNELNSRKSDIVLAIEDLKGKFIGIIGLHGINWKDRLATHGIFIGDKNYWSNGYGTDAGMILFEYAFNSLNLRKIRSMALGFNERSVKYHLGCGFKIVGRWRKDIFKKGKYWDLVLMDLFKKEWEAKFREYQKLG